MSSQLSQSLRRVAYTAAQTARMGWYSLQYVGARHIAGPITPPGEVPRPYASSRPDGHSVRRAVFDLFVQERDDIARGLYKMPRDMKRPPNFLNLLRQAQRYYKETSEITQRAYRKKGGLEVRTSTDLTGYPDYYLQNFHYQSDGWLSKESATIYDTQVEALFTGTADMMRRRALTTLIAEIDRLRKSGTLIKIADIGCGTGRLLGDLLDNRANIHVTALDLSEAYLKKAQDHIGKPRADYVIGNAEYLPFEDNSLDILFSVYLFHELPPKIRPIVAQEFARVLKPGGLYVHVDSAQYGDTVMDLMLEGFPRIVHEPYYDSYCQEDLRHLFGNVGFKTEDTSLAFLTKVSSFRLPEA